RRLYTCSARATEQHGAGRDLGGHESRGDLLARHEVALAARGNREVIELDVSPAVLDTEYRGRELLSRVRAEHRRLDGAHGGVVEPARQAVGGGHDLGKLGKRPPRPVRNL